MNTQSVPLELPHTQHALAHSFSFSKTLVRILLRDGEPWFVAADVCAALQLGNVTMALKRLDADEQALNSVEGISRGNDLTNVINESGLYSLILGSRKPEAKKFKKWVTSEVLPAIRRTGGYNQPVPEQHMQRCWQMAHAVVGPVQQALFDASFKQGPDELRFMRVCITFGHDLSARVERVGSSAVVATLGDLATMIEGADGVYPTDVELAKLSTACAQRLAQRVIYRANSPSPEAKGS